MSNRLYLWGDNSIYQIENITNFSSKSSPLLIATSINTAAVGGYHTIGTSGVARTYVGCGDNSQNQLTNSGADAGVGVKTPLRALSNNLPANIIQVEAGLQHSLYLTLDGTVTGRGNNTYGQTDPAPFGFNVLSNNGPYVNISAGNYHSIILNSTGNAYIFGRNNYGQIGNGSTSSTSASSQTWSGVGGIIQIAAGDYHTAIITGNNRLYLCGLNNRGQLGDNTQSTRASFVILGGNLINSIPLYWSKVSLGTQHSAAITTDGDLYTWGYNLYGQLGLGDTTNRSIPTLVSRINGHAWTEVSAGNGYTLAINANGDVYAWGWNNNNQLGDGTATNRLLPVKINTGISGTPVAIKAGSGYHSAALFSDVAVTTTTTTTANPALQRLTSYKFNNVSIPVSQTFRTDEYRTSFPNVSRMISSINDTKVNVNSSNSIEVTFNLDVLNLSLLNIRLLVHTKVNDCISSSWNLSSISITKVSDKTYIINGIDTPNNNPATLLINPGVNLSLVGNILTETNDTIIIPIAPVGVNEADSVYSCYRDYTAPTTTTTTSSTTVSPTTSTTTTTTVRPQIVGSCMSRGSFSKIQLRRATNAQFISANTILASGEPGYATDTRVIKVGDGYTPWSALLPVNISGTIDFPTLLASNNINISSVGSTYIIGATGLALSDHGHDVNDITGLSGVLNNLQPSGNYAPLNHQHVIGDITSFNPSGHKHVVADIEGLNLNNIPVGPHSHSVGDIYDISSYYSPIGHTHNLSEFDTSPLYRTNIYTIYPDYGGYLYISWAKDQQIQRVTLDGNPIMVYKNTGWPGYYDNYSVDVLLEISIPTDATSVDWTGMVNGWYSQPPDPMPVGTHLVLLRAMGNSVDGHYIGSK